MRLLSHFRCLQCYNVQDRSVRRKEGVEAHAKVLLGDFWREILDIETDPLH